MSYTLPKDDNLVRFFGKKTVDGNSAYMPSVIYGADGVTPISETNPFPASLKDRNVEEKILFQGKAITDTVFYASPIISVSPYEKVSFLVNSTLDQPITIYFQIGTETIPVKSTETWDGTAFGERSIQIPADNGFQQAIGFSDIDYDSLYAQEIKVVVNCSTAPTTGSLSLVLLGVKN